jgi:hypothetical protein
MKSPFPGMDPYIEACNLWEGFHHHLIESIYRALAHQLPKGFTADVNTRTYVVLAADDGKREHLPKPDVVVTSSGRRSRPRPKDEGVAGAAVADFPESLPMEAFAAEKFRETFIEIYLQGEDRTLITCIEVLSPSNKRPGTEGWKEYERKRQAMLLGQANFVELDLLRGGHKMPMRTPWPEVPYTLLVSRGTPHCRVWRAHFNARLPVIPVPLFDPHPDLRLDLQPLIDDIYALGRYDELIDYTRALQPRLSRADAAYVRERIKDRTSRT